MTAGWIGFRAIRLGLDERRKTLVSYRTGDVWVPALPEQEALLSVMAEFAAAITESRPPLTGALAGLARAQAA